MKPSWDEYFMKLCFDIRSRSLDPDTQHGCIFVDSHDHSIIVTGYNSPPSNAIEEVIPLTRPEKYKYFNHAEKSALLIAAKKGRSLEKSICYVTGIPCSHCMLDLLSLNLKEIVYGPIQSKCANEKESLDLLLIMKNEFRPMIRKFNCKG